MTTLLRKPSAWLPMAVSLVALALVLGFVARLGVVHSEDEGPAARIFQLLTVAQAVAIAFFALRWVPEAPKPAIAIIALQILVAAIPLAVVIFLEM